MLNAFDKKHLLLIYDVKKNDNKVILFVLNDKSKKIVAIIIIIIIFIPLKDLDDNYSSNCNHPKRA